MVYIQRTPSTKSPRELCLSLETTWSCRVFRANLVPTVHAAQTGGWHVSAHISAHNEWSVLHKTNALDKIIARIVFIARTAGSFVPKQPFETIVTASGSLLSRHRSSFTYVRFVSKISSFSRIPKEWNSPSMQICDDELCAEVWYSFFFYHYMKDSPPPPKTDCKGLRVPKGVKARQGFEAGFIVLRTLQVYFVLSLFLVVLVVQSGCQSASAIPGTPHDL